MKTQIRKISVARGKGFEPSLTVLETAVLSLHHPSIKSTFLNNCADWDFSFKEI